MKLSEANPANYLLFEWIWISNFEIARPWTYIFFFFFQSVTDSLATPEFHFLSFVTVLNQLQEHLKYDCLIIGLQSAVEWSRKPQTVFESTPKISYSKLYYTSNSIKKKKKKSEKLSGCSKNFCISLYFNIIL